MELAGGGKRSAGWNGDAKPRNNFDMGGGVGAANAIAGVIHITARRRYAGQPLFRLYCIS